MTYDVIRSFEDSFTMSLVITTAFLQLPRLRNTVFSKIALYRVQKFVFIKFALGGCWRAAAFFASGGVLLTLLAALS